MSETKKIISNADLIEKLKALPQDLPVMFKISQDIVGYDNFAWMRGECCGVSVEELFMGNDD